MDEIINQEELDTVTKLVEEKTLLKVLVILHDCKSLDEAEHKIKGLLGQ